MEKINIMVPLIKSSYLYITMARRSVTTADDFI